MPAVPQQTLSAEKSGDTLDYTITVSGVDLTLPGTQAWCTGKLSKDDPDQQAVFQKTIANGGLVVDSVTQMTLVLQPADTATLADGAVVYCDVQVKTASGRIQTPLEWTVSFEVDITQAT